MSAQLLRLCLKHALHATRSSLLGGIGAEEADVFYKEEMTALG